VGRSALPGAGVASGEAAVMAHIRHEHTNYDELLMGVTERFEARALVREQMDRVLASG